MREEWVILKRLFKSVFIYLWGLYFLNLLLCGAFFSVSVPVLAVDIPDADVTYGSDNNWEGTLVISENKTVKISSVEHSNVGEDGSAIRISGEATVNLIFEGNSVIAGNPSVISAGIEVEEGSTVNIYGMEGGSLFVSGGKYGAGIGGIGYTAASTENPRSGNINIYGGNITTVGGERGAGIGSGYHSSASDINIRGGNITALGTFGAGIGTGYGTSGGNGEPGVGFYNGGNINISGGTVKAAAYHMNFDDFDPYNIETLYGEGYSDTFAAGIGGGYGSSSGNIIIEGNADVIAIGSCGGAGIGSGRGTSEEGKYDADSFDVNITIKGNSKVIAMATDDRRTTVKGDDGGAAIGLGRGCTLGGQPKGTVKVEDNATVFAVAPDHAQAIGGSCSVGKFREEGGVIVARPADAHLASISFGSGTIVTAVSDGYRDSIDHINESDVANFLLLNFSDGEEGYFENRSDFFTEDKFPLKVEVIDADNTESKTMFAIQKPQKLCLMVRILGAKDYNFIVKDYQGEYNEKIFISNEEEKNSAQFFSNSSEVKRYDATGLTARLDRDGTIVDPKYGELKLKIEAKEGIFEYGSTFFCDSITDQAIIDKLNSELDKKYSDNLERILYFDIGVKDRNEENYESFTGGKVRIYVEIPDGWDKDEVLALFVQSLDDESFADTQKLETIDGVTYLSFDIDHFSDYALFDPMKISEDGSEREEENKNNTHFLSTGDSADFKVTVLLLILSGSLITFLVLFKRDK